MVGLNPSQKDTYLKLVQLSSLEFKKIEVFDDCNNNFVIYERKSNMKEFSFSSLQSDQKAFPFHALDIQARGDIKVLEVYYFTNSQGKKIFRITTIRDTLEF